MAQELAQLGQHIADRLGPVVTGHAVSYGELTIVVERSAIVQAASFLRDDPRCLFVCLLDVCGVDYPGRELRFDVVYHLLSPRHNQRIRIKVMAGEETLVPSIVSVFPNANWYERETYDLYGVLFSGHPDLRRLLTDYGFQGHPLRKDFPLTGFVEVRYDDAQKRVVNEPVKLQQEFATSIFSRPGKARTTCCPATRRPRRAETDGDRRDARGRAD
jgi:NADH-quinone oxidoreductase subunit C